MITKFGNMYLFYTSACRRSQLREYCKSAIAKCDNKMSIGFKKINVKSEMVKFGGAKNILGRAGYVIKDKIEVERNTVSPIVVKPLICRCGV